MSTNKILGISFPLLPKHSERLLSMDEAIFVKFMPHESCPGRLKEGMYFFIYRSRGNKEIVGRAKITGIKLIAANDVRMDSGDKLFIEEEDFKEYIKNREQKKMLALVLKDIKSFDVPIKLDSPVNMGGKYILEGDLRSQGKLLPR